MFMLLADDCKLHYVDDQTMLINKCVTEFNLVNNKQCETTTTQINLQSSITCNCKSNQSHLQM